MSCLAGRNGTKRHHWVRQFGKVLPRALANIEVQSRPDFEVDKIPTERHGETFGVNESRISALQKYFAAQAGVALKVEVAHSFLCRQFINDEPELLTAAVWAVAVDADFFSGLEQFFISRNAQHGLGTSIDRVNEVRLTNRITG